MVGGVLAAGLGIFLVGAAAWRLEHQRPLQESLPAIHRDRRRWAWTHVWMVAAMLVTPRRVGGSGGDLGEAHRRGSHGHGGSGLPVRRGCWIASLTFRLTVVPWVAEQTVTVGEVPDRFAAYDRWAGALYCVHMLTA